MRVRCLVVGSLLISSLLCQAQDKELPAEVVARLDAAVSAAPAVKPKAPRKVLVVYRCDGFRHRCIPVANKMLELLAARSGAFEATFTDKMDVFDTERLARFDAILFNNTTRLKFTTNEQRKALIDFVRAGKGVIGLHAASDNFYDFPEAAAMLGGMFDGHPWGAGGTWVVKLDESDHPLNAAFGGRNFEIKDEIYQIKGAYSRETHRVLLSLNMEHPPTGGRKGQKRADKDNPVSWIKRFGQGRVFYCSLGHNNEVYWNKAVVSHYLAGIQYALGDLAVDDSPSAPPESGK